jgi:pimeloyl-ACP methyl ester carboxylesterase
MSRARSGRERRGARGGATGEPATSRWVDLDGPTHYLDFGGPADGPLLVCVHGLGGSHLNWAAVGPRLAQACRVVAVDLAGHGRTQAMGRSTSVRENRRLLHRFLTEVVGTPAVLVGNSMGGAITILEAAGHPETVAGVVLVTPAVPQPRLTRSDPAVALRLVGIALPGIGERLLAERARRSTPEQQVHKLLELVCVDPSRVPAEVLEQTLALARERRDYPGRDAEFLFAARTLGLLVARRRRYEALTRAVRAPVLLLHGARDRLVPVAAARAVARKNPTWRFEVADDVGHVPQLEAADWTAATILDWLANEGWQAAEDARHAGRVAGAR